MLKPATEYYRPNRPICWLFLWRDHPVSVVRQAAWYTKALPAFSDALALVRQHLWSAYPTFRISKKNPDMVKIPLLSLIHLPRPCVIAA